MTLLISRNWFSSAGVNFFARAMLMKWLNCFQHSMWVSIWVTNWLSSLAVISLPGHLDHRGLREEENDCATAQLAGRHTQAREMDADFRKRHLGITRFMENPEHVFGNFTQ